MPKNREVKLPAIPVGRLVEYGMSTQINSLILLQELDKLEMSKDKIEELRDTMEKLMKSKKLIKLSMVYEWINTLNECLQISKSATALMYLKAEQIRQENYKANGILKFYDINRMPIKGKIKVKSNKKETPQLSLTESLLGHD